MGRAVPPLPYRKLAKALGCAGFVPVRRVGSHERWRLTDGRAATVPRATA
ncbi:MAG: type II toxin-antitoxin system HicA family toxin [Thermoplasmatota archaeon]